MEFINVKECYRTEEMVRAFLFFFNRNLIDLKIFGAFLNKNNKFNYLIAQHGTGQSV